MKQHKVPTCLASQEGGNEEGNICLSSLQIKKPTHSKPQHQFDKTNLGKNRRHSYVTPHQQCCKTQLEFNHLSLAVVRTASLPRTSGSK